tara:strand:+ start:233 stop:496 length:264 start_codon:yes stop_codon:yes gene_type:complete
MTTNYDELKEKDKYGDTKEYEFIFSVPCYMNYTIVAESEEQAREILENDGIEIDGEWIDCPDGDLSLEAEDYSQADLIEQLEIEEDE